MILLPFYFSNPQIRGYSVSFVRDSRANRRQVLKLKVEGTGETLVKSYRLSWRRFKKAVLRDFCVHL